MITPENTSLLNARFINLLPPCLAATVAKAKHKKDYVAFSKANVFFLQDNKSVLFDNRKESVKCEIYDIIVGS